uniref:Uncharacterized protein n=1 Tax=Anguilla anguilla TaxID=7936 RepID=A0A0E9UMU3_ANGAN
MVLAPVELQRLVESMPRRI